MVQTNYEKGVKFERELLNLLKSNGYEGCRTAGSHSPYDVICWKTTRDYKKEARITFKGEVGMIQCKVNKL